MSHDIAISVRGLSKSYTIAHDAEKYPTLAGTIAQRLRNPLKRQKKETFWALKDVSFDIKKGDVVGIIGRNGAGKSTLLKILSRITEPTGGEIDLYGRVGALLEVGTGFSGELSGRENVFLNGSILGMSKEEIRSQFDAIVDFAGVENFLDTPVKRYSSGMYVRLAFAVAAHLRSEVLIVDEVLAVGDAEFQKKCLGKMKDVSTGGRTVLFVSHSMASIQMLCSKTLVLHHGRTIHIGNVLDGVRAYSAEGILSAELRERRDRRGSGGVRCLSVEILGANNLPTNSVASGDKLAIRLTVESDSYIERVIPGVNLTNGIGTRVATFWSGFTDMRATLQKGENMLLLSVSRVDLTPGTYHLSVNIGIDGEALDDVEDAKMITVTAPIHWHPRRLPTASDHGSMFTQFSWK